MAEVKNILVFPAGTEIAFEIHHALRYSKFVKLYGATSAPCHANFVFENCVEGVPFVDEPGFIEALNAIVDEYKIDYIYPAHDSAELTMTREQARLHAPVVTSDLKTVELCRSKNLTYEYLSGASYLPKFYKSPADVQAYPVFIKPSVGQGSVGARRIDSSEQLAEALSDGVEYAICEYLPGQEITVDCFTDRHGVLRYVGPRTRDRIRSGIAVRTHFLDNDQGISDIAEDLNRRFNFNGAWFFQLKENAGGEYRLMEVAPRIAGTMGLPRNQGINMPLLTLYNMWDYDVDILNNHTELLLDRAFISRFQSDLEYDNVFVDYDDTVIMNGKVNMGLMAFLYQCRNEGKHIYLLTKHRGEVSAELKRYAIAPELFDEIIHLEKTDSKIPFIKPCSIFIDDSFAERKRVHNSCGIPVFDLDMVESLINWRA
jgi:hypothetical protein